MKREERKTINFTQFDTGWCMSAFLFYSEGTRNCACTSLTDVCHDVQSWVVTLGRSPLGGVPRICPHKRGPWWLSSVHTDVQNWAKLSSVASLPAIFQWREAETSNKLCQELWSTAAHPGCLNRKTALTNWLLKDRTSCWSLLWT